MKRILVKEYELSLKIRRKFLYIPYTKTILLKFEQAKLIDTIEFMESIKWNRVNIVIWLLNFIKKHSKTKISEKDKDYIMMYADEIITQIKQTFFEWCFWWKDNNQENSPFSSYITLLSEKLNTSPIELITNYTPNQLERLTEWIVWNANEWTKEWQRKNRLWNIQQRAKNRTDEDKEKIDNILKSMK